MPRQRKTDTGLPRSVYLRSGTYWLVKNRKWHKLGTDLHDALEAYARFQEIPKTGMPALIDRAMPEVLTGIHGETLKPSTIAQYKRAAETLKEVFQLYEPARVTSAEIYEMLDAFRGTPAVANRLMVVLGKVFTYAAKRNIVPSSPIYGVRRIKQKQRTRLILPAEYRAIYEKCTPRTQCIVELCARTGQRIGDILTLKKSQLGEEGISFRQQKTDTRLIIAWTPELRAVVERAKRLSPNPFAPTLFRTKNNRTPNYQNVWRSFKTAAKKAKVRDVTPHDLRAMAATTLDAEGGNAQGLLGHKDRRTTEIYLRSKTVPVVSGPRKVG